MPLSEIKQVDTRRPLDLFLALNRRWQDDHAMMVKLREALSDILGCEDIVGGMSYAQHERFRDLLTEASSR